MLLALLLPERGTTRGLVRTIALRCGRSSVREATRDNSCCLRRCANSPWRSISIIFSRILRMISMPGRFTPISRASVRMTSKRSRIAGQCKGACFPASAKASAANAFIQTQRLWMQFVQFGHRG